MIGNRTGLRSVTPETLAATNFARQYSSSTRITRAAAIRVVKLAAAAMGLKTAKIAMLDQLFACSKAVDWLGSAPPVVWPSNARLARSLGISISTMKYHLNGLVRAGLVAYSDGPTYQRSGRRDDQGNIIEATGIDLSPIAVRFAELTELVEAAEFAAKESQKLGYRRTILRKEVQALLFAASRASLAGDWGQYQARLDRIAEERTVDLDSRIALVADLEALLSEVEQAYDMVNQDLKFDAALPKYRPLLTTAEHSDSEHSNKIRPRANAHESNSTSASGRMAFENKPAETANPQQTQKHPQVMLSDDLQNISIDLIKSGCPAFETYAPGAFESWWNFKESARQVAISLNINPQVWQEAVAVLGNDLAASALAVTVQKAETGLVLKPGAYLRTLTQRGRVGELHISRSLFGLAQLSAGRMAEEPVPAPLTVFPDLGSVHYSPWAEIIRAIAPKPTPDVDVVANAFRRWARSRNVDLTGPNVEKALIGFCKKWRAN